MTEQEIEQKLVERLGDLKYTYRSDIRDRTSLEGNFRQKFETLNRVRLTDAEFARLRDEIINADVFQAAKTLREYGYFAREDGTPLHYMLVNLKDWCKNEFEVIHQLRINTDNSHHRYDVILLINGLPLVQIELKTVGINPRRAMEQIIEYRNDPGKGISKSDIKPNGLQPCIRYGELYTVYGDVIDSIVSKTDLPASDLFMSCEGDVILPSSGETKIDIATAACVKHKNIALGGDLNVIRSKHNGVFISYQLNGALRHEIAKVAQGDTVAHLYKNNLEKLNLLLPSSEEQQKIADCLSSLDTLITAHTEKLNALKTHKKRLMQQLFPSPEAVGA